MAAPALERCRDPLALPRPDPRIRALRVGVREGRVRRIRSLTHDTYEVVVACDGAESIGRAGQFWTLRVPGVARPRPYSAARAPEAERPGELTFFIRLVPGGELSAWLAAGDERVGEAVTLSGPLGRFGLDPSRDDMVCIAGGSGMSAAFAVLEHAANERAARNCYFFYGARTRRDLYQRAEIAALQRRWHPDYALKFVPVLSEEPEASDWDGARGLVTDHFRRHYLDTGQLDAGRIKAYFCGPPPMIDAGVSVLRDAGLPAASIYYDRFEDARSPAPVIDNAACVLCDECLMVKPVERCIVEVARLPAGGASGAAGYERVAPAATAGLYYSTLYIDERECIRCYACVESCPAQAISPRNDPTPRTLARVAG